MNTVVAPLLSPCDIEYNSAIQTFAFVREKGMMKFLVNMFPFDETVK